MDEYLKAQNKTNEFVMSDELAAGELSRLSNADLRWADTRLNPNYSKRRVKRGEIYQFEFGKGYKPEIAYEHRGLVIWVVWRRKVNVFPDKIKIDFSRCSAYNATSGSDESLDSLKAVSPYQKWEPKKAVSPYQKWEPKKAVSPYRKWEPKKVGARNRPLFRTRAAGEEADV